MTDDLLVSIQALLPLIFLVGWTCLLLLVDLFIPANRKGWTAVLAAVGLGVTLVLVLLRLDQPISAFNGMLVVDGFANFQNILLLASGLVGIALAYDYLRRMGLERGEYYSLLLFSLTGMMLMGMSTDLIMIFLALELLSIPLYILAGIATPRPSSEEAALKYFLLGAYSSAFFLFGTALVYGATGQTALSQIVAAASSDGLNGILLLVGAGLILVGLGFKVAAVPFHMWTPDVYHGAPSPITAFMAVGAKVAGFAALLRVFVLAFPSLAPLISSVLWTLAALTMILGNLVAIAQRNIKRLLAYSSIAHAGYILMALAPYGNSQVSQQTVASALFYLVAYAFTNFAAWAVVIALEQAEEKGLALQDYAGLGRKYPALAAAMTVAMLSFTGVPPTLGFAGKFYLFSTVLQGGYLGLALIGVLTSLVSAYYYLRVVVVMYMQEGEPQVRRDPWLVATAYGSAIAIVALSIFASPLFAWASQAVFRLF